MKGVDMLMGNELAGGKVEIPYLFRQEVPKANYKAKKYKSW